MFFGLHERQLDDKGRVALPATFRADLGDRCYLVIGDDRCIEVYSSEEFENRARDMIEAVRRGDETAERRRALAHSATLATIDKQGRVTVEEKLRDFARIPLSTKVFVAGNLDRVELWSEAVYTEISDRATAAVARGDS
jgi:MraZ protein